MYRSEVLQKKLVSDVDTIEMIEHVFNGFNVDVATALHSEIHLVSLIRSRIKTKSNDIATAYDEKADTLTESLEFIMAQFEMNNKD